MSQESFMQFLTGARDNTAMLTSYNQRNLSQLLFHAKNDGYDFTAEDMAAVAGKLEANVILNKDRDPFDGTSRLWRHMWGKCHLEYLVKHVAERHTNEELQSFIAKREQEVL
jgi:hypothetical protein